MDFITDLPRVGDHDTMLVVVDRFSKMAFENHFGEGDDRTFLKNVVRLHGFLEDVTFDRGPQFISHFYRDLRLL